MFQNLSSTNINFYNYILSKQNLLNPQSNFSPSNFALFKNSSLINSDCQNLSQSNQSTKAIKNIKVNKLNSNDISINNIYFQTNRDFYRSKPFNKRNKSTNNYFKDNYTTINYNNINTNAFIPYHHKKTKSDMSFVNNNFISNTNFEDNSYGKFNIRDNILKNLISEKKNKMNISKEIHNIYNFKNIKMFYAHLELFLSLYLKKNFVFFIQRIKQYKKYKNTVNNNLYNSQPIINLNNAHCSLYCSININKDNNEIFNNEQNFKILNKNNKNNYFSKKDIKNKNIYVPKNKTKNLKENKSNRFIIKDKNRINNNEIKKSSPIKEMNIDLKKMNFNENKTKNQKSINNFKNKLKISNSKNNIYKRPKDSNNISKKIIKEIKIQNKELILTPYENRNKKFFDTIYSCQQSTINKDNNNIKKIYIRKNNSNNEIDNIKTTLFRNQSNINYFRSFSDFVQYKPKEILIKKIITPDKRIFININYINLESFGASDISKNKIYISLKAEHNLSLTIIKNTLLILENINVKMIFSDIFIFDNDKKNNLDYNKISKAYFNEIENNSKENKSKAKIDTFKFAKIIKNIIIINIRKYLLKKYKKDILLRKLISIKNNKILKHYFKKFIINKNITSMKSGIYHKINYNDDFNLNKKVKSPISVKNSNIFLRKINPYSNLNSKNNNILYRNKNKKNKNQTQSSTNYSHNYKYWNKEFNITVHENKNNNINNINKKKNINSYFSKNKK